MKKLFIYVLLLGSALVNAADYWPASCLQSTSIGQTINGHISTSSDCYEISSDATKAWYTDVYTFNGTAGQKIAITMTGVGDFDPDLSLYLGNTNAAANNIEYNDDGGGGVNARIPADTGYITLASTQTYFIWASTPYRNTGGSYTLTVASSSRYTKIANNGADLPASALLGSGATQWACTRDNTTGLVWEVKSTDGGLRDLNKTYTNYDDPTQPQKSNASSVTNPTQAEIDAASNSIGFLNAVNSSRLCGSSGWWMPSRDELFGLVNSSYTPKIDLIFFPNTLSSDFWSGSLDLDSSSAGWFVCFGDGNCMYGERSRFYGESVRLVNNGQYLLRPQTILFSSPPNLFRVGGTASLRASASSSLPVTISSSTPNICTHTGNTVRGEAVRLCYLMANQAGNVNFSPAPQAGIGFYIDMASVLPGAPTITSFVAESRRATIHFSPPSNTGGSPIALYTATCAASGQTARLATGTVSPLTVINLTGGVTYQCTLTATNSGGSSSAASGAVSVTAKKNSITPILMLLLD